MDPARLESMDMGPARLDSTESPSSLESTQDNETGGRGSGVQSFGGMEPGEGAVRPH